MSIQRRINFNIAASDQQEAAWRDVSIGIEKQLMDAGFTVRRRHPTSVTFQAPTSNRFLRLFDLWKQRCVVDVCGRGIVLRWEPSGPQPCEFLSIEEFSVHVAGLFTGVAGRGVVADGNDPIDESESWKQG